MIFVGYNPFDIDAGFIYRSEKGQLIDDVTNIPSTINDLAQAAAAYAYKFNDFDISFKPEFAQDTEEFISAINCYEMMNYNENKITVREVE